jgi:hypothetical protein
MPVTTFTVVLPDAGHVMVQMRQLVAGNMFYRTLPDWSITFNFVVVDGLNAALINILDAEGNGSSWVLIDRSLPDGTTYTVPALTNCAGFNAGVQSAFQSPPSSPAIDWEEIYFWWFFYVATFKEQMVASWANGVINSSEPADQVFLSDTHAVAVWASPVTYDSGVSLQWEQLCGYDQTPQPQHYSNEMIPDTVDASGVVLNVDPGLSSIAKSLDVMANSDTNISFNNNSVMYGIRSRTVTEL